MVHPVIRWRSQPCNSAEHHSDGVREDERQKTQSTSHSFRGAHMKFISACVQLEAVRSGTQFVWSD